MATTMADETKGAPGADQGKQPDTKPEGQQPGKQPERPEGQQQPAGKPEGGQPQPKEAKAGAERKRVALEADEEIPADADLIELSPRALKSRLERATKRELKERFGVDDPKVIAERLAKLEALEKAEEEKRLADLTEQDRLKEQLKAAEERAQRTEQRFTKYRSRQEVEKTDRHVAGIMGQHIAPKFLQRWVPDLKRYVETFTDEDLARSDELIAEWCAKQVEESPEIGVGFRAGGEEKPRVGLTTGADTKKPDNQDKAGGPADKKTAAPGKPNSMTKAEHQEYMRSLGLRY